MVSEAIPLHTLRWGEGDRKVLLIHGIGSNAEGWWRVGPALAATGREIVAVDLRGHGLSPKSDDYRFSAHVADVLAVGSDWEAVLGHSMGGLIATLAAYTDPSWTRGIVLQDPALLLPDSQEEVLRWLLDEYRRPITPDQLAFDNPRWVPEDAEIKARALLQVGADCIEKTTVVNWPWMALEQCATLDLPRIVIGSDPATGGLLPVTIGNWLGGQSRSRYTVLENSSHSAHRDADIWDAYLATIVDALDALPTL